MAEMKFTCPSCGQHITCDEQWGGHQIPCPVCQKPLVVPISRPAAAPSAPPPRNSLVPEVPTARSPKLALGTTKQEEGAAPQKNIPIRNLAPPPEKKKSILATLLPVLGIVIILGAAGYFGWPYFKEWKEKRAGGETADASAAKAPAPAPAPATPDGQPAAGVDATGAPAAPPTEAVLPLLPPIYNLDVATAKIPEGRANGMLSGTNFVVENARIDPAATAQVLRLFQGSLPIPDREVLIYLHPKPGEALPGQTFTVAKETRGTGLPTVVKRWKTDPRYAPKMQSFNTGYALKLEFAQPTNGAMAGKIYLALPDKEESVVAGIFKIPVAGAEGSPDQAQPAPGTMPGTEGMSPAQRELFQRRYGVRKGG